MNEIIEELKKQKEQFLQNAQAKVVEARDADKMAIAFNGAAQGVQFCMDKIVSMQEQSVVEYSDKVTPIKEK
jgi:hypothetical protein